MKCFACILVAGVFFFAIECDQANAQTAQPTGARSLKDVLRPGTTLSGTAKQPGFGRYRVRFVMKDVIGETVDGELIFDTLIPAGQRTAFKFDGALHWSGRIVSDDHFQLAITGISKQPENPEWHFLPGTVGTAWNCKLQGESIIGSLGGTVITLDAKLDGNQAATKLSPAEFKRASVDGKYVKLLRKLHLPEEKATHGEFRDYGHYPQTDYLTYKNLPAGYWVYVFPHWYIWDDLGVKSGDQVVVLHHNIGATVHGETVSVLAVGVSVVAEKVEGDRLFVKSSPSGWIRRKDVVSWDRALTSFNDRIRRNPQDGRAWHGRGNVYLARGEIEKGLVDLNRAFSLGIRDDAVLNSRGYAYLHKQQFDRAIQDLNEAHNIKPDNSSVLNNLAAAWEKKGEDNKALGYYTQALRIDPNNWSALSNRAGIYHRTKKFRLAIDDLKKAIQVDPKKEVTPYIQLGTSYNAVHEYDNAESAWSKGIEVFPEFTGLYYLRAMVRASQDNLAGAIADLTKTIESNRRFAKAWSARGSLRFSVGDYANAVHDLEQASVIGGQDWADPYSQLAWLYATCPDPSFRDARKAVSLSKRACDLTKWENPWHLESVSAAFAESGNFSAAVKWQQKALEMAPEDKQVEFRKRLQLYQQGKPYREPPRD